ncbi:hypothetical protein SDRG_10389 [Saprolegnia diclina VS20]|uniref:CCHC-type domain-containing protein n=1 Tax=Saprolegnia diclina (strain VS20) TaxID=1156394 RepID=T0QB35_SAPDV|nr:hypothetical protein SDRG_10389 [Saprolegnia diclina VS20]EQC31871.1 hypothetical protein SDRG_10389 [Saprolegnia diclina VS20]|eukprot:XP_008614599.1 hypothetical protein SDRG_10389 [Saprolegnia diclina VS20]
MAGRYPGPILTSLDGVAAWRTSFLTCTETDAHIKYYLTKDYLDPSLADAITADDMAQMLRDAKALMPTSRLDDLPPDERAAALAQRRSQYNAHINVFKESLLGSLQAARAKAAAAYLSSAIAPALAVGNRSDPYKLWQRLQRPASSGDVMALLQGVLDLSCEPASGAAFFTSFEAAMAPLTAALLDHEPTIQAIDGIEFDPVAEPWFEAYRAHVADKVQATLLATLFAPELNLQFRAWSKMKLEYRFLRQRVENYLRDLPPGATLKRKQPTAVTPSQAKKPKPANSNDDDAVDVKMEPSTEAPVAPTPTNMMSFAEYHKRRTTASSPPRPSPLVHAAQPPASSNHGRSEPPAHEAAPSAASFLSSLDHLLDESRPVRASRWDTQSDEQSSYYHEEASYMNQPLSSPRPGARRVVAYTETPVERKCLPHEDKYALQEIPVGSTCDYCYSSKHALAQCPALIGDLRRHRVRANFVVPPGLVCPYCALFDDVYAHATADCTRLGADTARGKVHPSYRAVAIRPSQVRGCLYCGADNHMLTRCFKLLQDMRFKRVRSDFVVPVGFLCSYCLLFEHYYTHDESVCKKLKDALVAGKVHKDFVLPPGKSMPKVPGRVVSSAPSLGPPLPRDPLGRPDAMCAYCGATSHTANKCPILLGDVRNHRVRNGFVVPPEYVCAYCHLVQAKVSFHSVSDCPGLRNDMLHRCVDARYVHPDNTPWPTVQSHRSW